jgi:hypothetical protein
MKPIFLSKTDGTAYQSGYAVDQNGTLQKTGILKYVATEKGYVLAPQRIPIKNANLWGVLTMTPEAFASMYQQKPAEKMNNETGKNGSFILAEKQTGALQLGRMESANGYKGQPATFNLTMDYTKGAPGTFATIVLGDGAGSIAQLNNVPPLPPGLVIGGDRGANTLAWYTNRWATGRWHRLKKANFQSGDAIGGNGQGIYQNTNLLSFCEIMDERATLNRKTPYNFLLGYTGSNFNLAIRYYDDFDYLLSQDSAIILQIPAGFSLAMTSEMYSVNGIQPMQLENK